MTTMRNNNDFLIGAVLIAGAFWYSRTSQARAAGAPVTTRPPLGTGSMPSTVGSGAAQVVGGAVGSMLNTLFGGSQVPITSGGNYYNWLTSPDYIANQVRSEQAWDQQTPDVFVGGNVSTTGQDQIWTVG
ncbi:hypothetical protein [Undibacterium sp.]|uniref:hypothetical protein n=1 Tax=Undibacterium sp. TaxID=1914977 RepID=UPI00273050D9|nr:hypothetical protein [Undibacterium sp.]MDP1978047.1 hypothetical protein [Undibacterium sp.]